MKIIRPVTVTDNVLAVTNVPEDDAPVWSGSGTYSTSQRVMLNHTVYESAVDDNAVNPEIGVNNSPPEWIEVSATNPWRMFDQKIGSNATALQPIDPSYLVSEPAADGISLTLAPNALADGLALFGLSGVHLNVKVETGDGVIYERRQSLSGGISQADWWSYFFDPVERVSQVVLTDLPTGLDAQVHIAVGTGSDPAEVGQVILGRVNKLGCSQYGSGIGIRDYSIKERDDFGQVFVRERSFARRAEVDFMIDNSSMAAVDRLLSEVRAKPTVYIIADHFEALIVYGFYSDWFITVDNFSFSDATISLEGLT